MEVQEAPVIVFHVCYEIDTGFLFMTFFKTVLGTVVLVLFFFFLSLGQCCLPE